MKRTRLATRHPRAGFSLMEVLVASGMLISSLIVLNQLSTLGRISANSTESRVTAQLLCEQKMNLILSGMELMTATDDSTFEEDETWHYAIELEPVETLSLTKLTVRVWQDEEEVLRPQNFHLVRWIASPPEDGETTESDSTSATVESNINDLDF